MRDLKIINMDVLEGLKSLPEKSIQCVVTSPPYWGLRDYGVDGQIGLEKTPEEFIDKMVSVFSEVRRVLRDNGTLWMNLGDSYASDTRGSGGTGKSTLTNGGACKEAAQVFAPRKVEHGLKPKDLIGIPWRVALALQSDGWYLRSDIIWAKPNPMPESVTDRPTKAHEYIFLLTKEPRYYYDAEAIKEPAIYFDDDRSARASADHKSAPTAMKNGIRPVFKDAKAYDGKNSKSPNGLIRDKAVKFGAEWNDTPAFRNKRSVWEIATQPYPEAHFATFPEELPRICIKAGTKENDTVLDPFCGAGTTGLVALSLNRNFIGIELNPKYCQLAENRIRNEMGLLLDLK